MIRRSLTFIITISLTGGVYAQEQKSVLKLADEAYAREEYALAGSLYQRETRSKESKAPVALLMKMARSFQEIGRFEDAAVFYRQIIARPEHPAAAYFAYGEALRQLEQYDSARQQYALFTTSNTDSVQLKEIALRGCDSAAVWTKGPQQLKPLKELNTTASDLVSSIMSNGLLLTSNGYRKQLPTDKRTQQPYYKAYVYRQNTYGNSTMYLEELLPEVFDQYNYHIGPVYVNRTEDTLYATINMQDKGIKGLRRLQIYQSIKTGGKWSRPALLQSIHAEGYSSSHAVLNTSGSILYFVSDRPGGKGQTDLWYSEKQADGTWGAPLNCGDKINTIAEETFPTVNEDGVLYFSSKGHAGLGGYDIFRAKGEKGVWEMPVNMKAPFNSGADEIGFVLKSNGIEGFLASNKPGGMGGDDIYSFVDPDFYNRVNGVNTENVVVRSEHPRTTPVVKKLTPEEEADKRSLEDLKFFYDYKSAGLLTASQQILDKVAAIMARHPHWKIIVASFADNRGSDEYNNDLSAQRCLAVIEYLSGKGIDPKRIYYANKGERDPVNKCKDGVPCSEEEYRENRRSELLVMIP